MSQQDLAALFTVTPRHIGDLTRRGIIPREPDGAYDAFKAVPAFLQARSGEFEWRKARTAAMSAQTASAALRTRRQLGEVMGVAELQFFTDETLGVCVRLWTAISSMVYGELARHIGAEPARLAAHEVDLLAKDELGILRERLKLMAEGMRSGLAEDAARLDRLQAELAGEVPPPVKPARRRKAG